MKLKKTLSLLLAVIMAMSLCTLAFAGDAPCEHRTVWSYWDEGFFATLDLDTQTEMNNFRIEYEEKVIELIAPAAEDAEALAQNCTPEAYCAFLEKYQVSDETVAELSLEADELRGQLEQMYLLREDPEFDMTVYLETSFEYEIKSVYLALYAFTGSFGAYAEEIFDAEATAESLVSGANALKHGYLEDYEYTVYDEATDYTGTETHSGAYSAIRQAEYANELNDIYRNLSHKDFEIAPTATCSAAGTKCALTFCEFCKELLAVDSEGNILGCYSLDGLETENEVLDEVRRDPERFLFYNNARYQALVIKGLGNTEITESVLQEYLAVVNKPFSDDVDAMLEFTAPALGQDGLWGMTEHHFVDYVCTECGAEDPSKPSETTETPDESTDDGTPETKTIIDRVKEFIQKIIAFFTSLFRR